MKVISDKLFSLQDVKYQVFTSKLIPNIDQNKIIGVKTPIIRKLAKEIVNEPYIEDFLTELPHTYHEENILHGTILTMKYKDIDTLLKKIDEFLKYVDSWAVCDTINPKLFKKYPDKVYKYIQKWLKSNDEYTIRFGVVSLLQFYLDDNFNDEILILTKRINSEYFYVKMALAWFYSFALIKQYDVTIKLFENKELNQWIHNKAIQKAVESYRISDERKLYLKTLKIK